MTFEDKRPFWKRIRPEEYILLLFLLTLVILVEFGMRGRYTWEDVGDQFVWRVGHYFTSQWSFLSVPLAMALLVGGYLFLLWKGWVTPVARFLRDSAPYLLSYLTYVLLRDLIPFIREDIVDAQLAEIETRLLGVPSYVWIPRNFSSSALDYILMGCYLTHYYIPLLVAVVLAFRNPKRFRIWMFALTLVWVIGYLGYIAVPAIGPRYYFSNYELWRLHESIQPLGGWIDTYASVTRDCFPSLHMAWAILTLWGGRKYRPFFWMYLPIVVGIGIATLYFGYHYLVDLPAGIVLAVVSIWFSRKVYRWWMGNQSDKVDPCDSAPSNSGSPPA